MKWIKLLMLVWCTCIFGQNRKSGIFQVESFRNIWTKEPGRIPNNVSTDAPLMGNGDLKMSVGYKDGLLRYYLSKNDFWRLRSESDNLSGPRTVGFLDITVDGFDKCEFMAEQSLRNGLTTCFLNQNGKKIAAKSWVSATDNLVFVELKALDKEAKIKVSLTSSENVQADYKTGKQNTIDWFTSSFRTNVDIPSQVAIALKKPETKDGAIVLRPGKTIVLMLAVESQFKQKQPLEYVLNKLGSTNQNSVEKLMKSHNKWWDAYWNKSSIMVQDTVLMKAYYQGLYTMAACSRDPKFPPGLFGWETTDKPNWNGDYHLNYNFQAPFYALASSNRLEQLDPHDAPLLDFMPRGAWYASQITHARGILYPVGIGPLGIETTRNHPDHKDTKDLEEGGLFLGQRSNSAYCLLNMAQHWRCTYDNNYGKKIYPFVLGVVNFWEDYLKFENGRYVIYGDAIHEGSGKDKNPILTLGLLRNAFDLVLDLSTTLKVDQLRQEKWKSILANISDFPTQIRNDKKVFRYTEEGVAWWDGNGLGIQHIYPSNSITLDSKEELLTVARNTIHEMQRWQDPNTTSSFYVAAIRVGYDQSVVMNELHKYALHTYPNGFQLGNPHGIENSCTVTNALNEMLCMSAGNTIRLFSGFAKNEKASFENIRTWGAFLVSASLDNANVSNVKIFSEKGKVCTLINPWPNEKVVLVRNGKKAEMLEGNRISFNTAVHETIELMRAR